MHPIYPITSSIFFHERLKVGASVSECLLGTAAIDAIFQTSPTYHSGTSLPSSSSLAALPHPLPIDSIPSSSEFHSGNGVSEFDETIRPLSFPTPQNHPPRSAECLGRVKATDSGVEHRLATCVASEMTYANEPAPFDIIPKYIPTRKQMAPRGLWITYPAHCPCSPIPHPCRIPRTPRSFDPLAPAQFDHITIY